MVIVFVVDAFDTDKNGTTMTARRFVERLRKAGHEVRVVTTGEPGEDKYLVPEWKIPVAQNFAHNQGFCFAKPDEEVLRRALQGADVVHLMLPLQLERVALKVAREMGVPCSAAFHLQPENVTYILHMDKIKSLPNAIYRWMKSGFYEEFDHIHCPSEFIAGQLRQNGYKAKLHVISNGVTDVFKPPVSFKPEGERFHILMVGRLSPEKRQDLIIEAAKISKYANRIQLHFAGRGPCQKKLQRLSQGLAYPPTFGIYSTEKLIELIHSCDLYVHASDVEIEAISCLEAIACGLVPVIADSEKSATPQFALDSRSLFIAGDAWNLAQKMDYWIEHPDQREKMAKEYALSTYKYRVDACVERAVEMFYETIEDAKAASN